MIYEAILLDMKFIKFAAKLGQGEAAALGHLIALWTSGWRQASEVVGDPGDVELSAVWRGESGALFALLRDGGWIDEQNGVWNIHDFWEYAPRHVKMRRARLDARAKPIPKKKRAKPKATIDAQTAHTVRTTGDDLRTKSVGERDVDVAIDVDVAEEEKKPLLLSEDNLPPALDTDQFRKSFRDLKEYRTQARHRPYPPKTVDQKLREFAEWGHDAAIQAIQKTISNAWQGVFKPDDAKAERSSPKWAGKEAPKPFPTRGEAQQNYILNTLAEVAERAERERDTKQTAIAG